MMDDGLPVRRVVPVLIAALAALAGLLADGTSPSRGGAEPPLASVAEALCGTGEPDPDFKGGFLPLMGLATDAVPMRRFREAKPVRYLMTPAQGCRDGVPPEKRQLILWHIVRPGQGLYYLTDAGGELALAVEGIAAIKANYLLASTKDPDIMIDFAGEKAFWLARFAAGRSR